MAGDLWQPLVSVQPCTRPACLRPDLQQPPQPPAAAPRPPSAAVAAQTRTSRRPTTSCRHVLHAHLSPQPRLPNSQLQLLVDTPTQTPASLACGNGLRLREASQPLWTWQQSPLEPAAAHLAVTTHQKLLRVAEKRVWPADAYTCLGARAAQHCDKLAVEQWNPQELRAGPAWQKQRIWVPTLAVWLLWLRAGQQLPWLRLVTA
mmetsp:Transcript_124442/g.229286  ORF Transcript_124442/g.229286 Transcript_124442/m.229286 type:complete len:204 (-) Transcript_124442:8-619(-)